MARMRSFPLFIVFSILIISSIALSSGAKTHDGTRKGKMRLKLKITKFKVFWHDIVSGRNPTSVLVVPPAANPSSASRFGTTMMTDNALTAGPEANSTVVGRAQGFYMSASQSPPVSLMMAMNFVFVAGKYNGSSITLMGPNPLFSKVREIPVLGGGGLFRFARGYARLTTHWLDLTTGDATVKYTMVVLHH